jgi:hypothetical protein
MHAGLGDDHPSKGVPDQNRRSFLALKHALSRADASDSVVSGFCTAVALSPAACNRASTSDQQDPSANNPCTRTTLRAFVRAFASVKRIEISEAAAAETKAIEKARLLFVMTSLAVS